MGRTEALFEMARADAFFSRIAEDVQSFGVDVSYHFAGGAGAYMPYALSTVKLDTPEKQTQFGMSFLTMAENKSYPVKLRFLRFLSFPVMFHYFLHEMMHVYQDMHGAYLLPLQEEGVFPVVLDLRGSVVLMLFCEAWAETEAIRASWRMREKGVWRGAVRAPDWRELAGGYEADMQAGMEEGRAAANVFDRWYEGKHRSFYEQQAAELYEDNFTRYLQGVGGEEGEIGDKLRCLTLPALMMRFPVPEFFSFLDLDDKKYTGVCDPAVRTKIEAQDARFGACTNGNIQDIKCGAPIYLWKRLKLLA